MNQPTDKPSEAMPLDMLRDWADEYCKGKEMQRVLIEHVFERFIVLADEKLHAAPQGSSVRQIPDEGARPAVAAPPSSVEPTIRAHLIRKLRSYAGAKATPHDLQIALGDAATLIEQSAPSASRSTEGVLLPPEFTGHLYYALGDAPLTAKCEVCQKIRGLVAPKP